MGVDPSSGPVTVDEAYDGFQYENYPFAATHPDWLRTIGKLHGLDPAPVEHCRVLELGSGRGGNLVPLAALFPDSEFVGVDLAASQVADGRQQAASLGLSNVSFMAMDICDVPSEWGAFDYVICHGVYSWVPEEVRARILEIAATQLTPHGLAYISYNTYPGWHARGMLRSMMRRVVPAGSPAEMAAAAREFVQMYLARTPADSPLRPWVESELSLLIGLSDRYIYFEHLVENNTAFYLSEFVDQAHGAGLAYVADADPTTTVIEQAGRGAEELMAQYAGSGRIAAEEMIDYLTTRYFRRSLLCRADAPMSLPVAQVTPGVEMAPRLAGSWLAVDAGDDVVDLGEGVEVSVEDDDNVVITSSDVHGSAISWVLVERRPQPMDFEELVAAAAERLGLSHDAEFREHAAVRAWRLFQRGKITIGWWRRPRRDDVPERPVVSALARHQAAAREDTVTTMAHERMMVDSLDRCVLQACDGSRTEADLQSAAAAALEAGELSIELDGEPLQDMDVLNALVTEKLLRYAQQCLFVVEPA